MGHRETIDASEFRAVYDAFRVKQLGCKADGQWGDKDRDFHWVARGHGEDWCVQYTGIPNKYWDEGIEHWAKTHVEKKGLKILDFGRGECDHKKFEQVTFHGKDHWDFTKDKVTLGITVWKHAD